MPGVERLRPDREHRAHAKFEILRPDGSVEVLDDTPFNWEDQSISKVDATISAGDKVKASCMYENNTGKAVTFGSSSAAEMCFNFARYDPKDVLSLRLPAVLIASTSLGAALRSRR